MTKLMINDLVESTELDAKAMSGVFGGDGGLLTIIKNRVKDNDASSLAALDVASALTGTNTNLQFFTGHNNGVIWSPVDQENDFDIDVYTGDTKARG